MRFLTISLAGALMIGAAEEQPKETKQSIATQKAQATATMLLELDAKAIQVQKQQKIEKAAPEVNRCPCCGDLKKNIALCPCVGCTGCDLRCLDGKPCKPPEAKEAQVSRATHLTSPEPKHVESPPAIPAIQPLNVAPVQMSPRVHYYPQQPIYYSAPQSFRGNCVGGS